MISKKIKNLIGLGLGSLLLGTVAFGMSSPDLISRLTRAESNYICAGNVRLEPTGDGSYTITHIGAGATTVDMSTILETYDVVTISADAFDDCRDTLTSITIDANIPIEDGAFNNMANELDVTFTGDATEINYGHIFENTTIGTMTIPETVTSVSEETFYGVKDTTTLVYEGSFDNFYNSIFHSLWDAFNTTINSDDYSTASMPSNIVVNGITYRIPCQPEVSQNAESYYFGSNTRPSGTFHCYYFKEGTTPSTNQITQKCSFGINNQTYYKNDNKL